MSAVELRSILAMHALDSPCSPLCTSSRAMDQIFLLQETD